jgi:hypothetical protein
MEVLGVRSMCEEWHLSKASQTSNLYADASAALSIAKRQGAGKMRHINVKSLWLQEKSLQAILKYNKIRGEDNPADGLTKHVRQELAQQKPGDGEPVGTRRSSGCQLEACWQLITGICT